MLPGDFTLLQVTPALDAGGVETLTVEMAAAVAATGARSLVASRGGRLEGELSARGAELIRLPLDARDPVTMAANALRLERVIRRERVSLVHVRSRAPAFSAGWAARRAGIPIVSAYHGIYAACSPMKRWYNAVMTRTDAVIVNSAFTRDHVLAQHRVAADKLALIPEGVDPAAFDPARVSAGRVQSTRAAWGVGNDRLVILVAARLTGWKGHRLIIDALAQSRERGRAHLVFVGRGDDRPYGRELAAAAARAGVALTLAGPSDDMPASFLAADLVAAPSLEPESFGRTVAEAGAMTRVVLATGLGGPAETIASGKTGFLVPPGDAPAWSAALDRALAMSRAERAAMGAAARERIEAHFSTQRMCEATFALYRRLSETKS
jgi:glycosyltransferase involved in cell wall biosynthesis